MSTRLFPFLTTGLWLLLAVTLPAAPRRLEMNFKGQLSTAVDELREKMQADNQLRGRKLQPGTFFGPNLPDSNFGLAFERDLKEAAADLLTDKSDFQIRGEYDFIPGVLPENEGLQVIQFVLKVIGPGRREMHSIIREVNDTGDITRITGPTVSLPDTPDIETRNKAALQATESPSFNLREGTRISSPAQPNYAVEILKRAGGTGPPTPLAPTDQGGLAFVDLAVSDAFEIGLYNFDTTCDAVAKVTIDGLDVVNEFCEDQVGYSGYTVPRSTGEAGRHVVPGWLKSAKQTDNNVFRFVINELGKGAATARKSRMSKGVITVQFFEAVPPGESLPSRNFGEVGTGQPMTVKYKAQPMTIRESPIVTVSIRYSNVPPQ